MDCEMKDRIIRETFRLLLRKGLYGVSISDIQNAVGASRSLVYHHFKNKEDLLYKACMHYCVQRYRLSVDELKSLSTRDIFLRMHQIRRGLIDSLSAPGGERVSIRNYNLLFYQASQRFPDLMKELKVECEKLEYHVRLAQKNGEIRGDIDPAFFIRLYFYTFDGASNYITGIDCEGEDEEDVMLREVMRFYEVVKA